MVQTIHPGISRKTPRHVEQIYELSRAPLGRRRKDEGVPFLQLADPLAASLGRSVRIDLARRLGGFDSHTSTKFQYT